MNITRPPHQIPQALNALVIALQLIAIAACIWICRSASGWTLFVLAAVFGLVMNSVYSVIHEAEHRILFATLWINEAAGMLMALLFVLGVMNLLWVATITLFVLIEKLLPQSRWISRLAGAICIVWGSWMMLSGARA